MYKKGLLSSCSAWASYCGSFSCCRAWALGARALVVVAHGLSFPAVCGILVPTPRIKPRSPALADGLLISGPPEKSPFFQSFGRVWELVYILFCIFIKFPGEVIWSQAFVCREFLIIDSISLTVIGLFKLSIYSWFSFDRLYVSRTEKAMALHSSTLAWKILWMEEPGRLQPVGLLRVGHD